MTGPAPPGPAPPGPAPPGPVPPGPVTARPGAGPGGLWRRALPEIVIAAAAVAATAAAGYAVAGPGGFAAVAVAAGVISLLVLRSLARPPSLGSSPEDVSGPDPAVPTPVLSSFSRQWRRRSRLADAQASMTAYRQACAANWSTCWPRGWPSGTGSACTTTRTPHGGCLPGAVPLTAASGHGSTRPGRPRRTRPVDQPGIPYRTLARLIDRLEHL